MPTQQHATGRETESLVLRAIAQRHQHAVAEAVGLSTSQVSRIVSGECGITLDRLGPFLEAIGLRVIDDAGDCVTVKREYLAALRCLARNSLTSETP